MSVQAQQLYLRTKVNTASKGELTLMLFDGCIKFMKQALEGIRTKNFVMKNINIKKAIDIIDELRSTLDMKFAISKNLSALYRFINERLIEANVKASEESLSVSIGLVTELRDTWVEMLKIVKSKPQAT